jgi:hypothetical protein
MPIKGYEKGNYDLIEMQHYSNVGPNPFPLIAYKDPCIFLEHELHVYTNSEGTEELEIGNDEDFTYGTIDVLYSSKDFENKNVFGSLKILNPDYQYTDLWITYYRVADYVSSEMMNRFDRGIDQMTDSILTTLAATVVVDNNGNLVVQGEEYPGYREEL